MTNVSTTLKSDEGIDNATGRQVKISTPTNYIGNWYPELLDAYEKCKSRGWGISPVQDCLYIGCYETGRFAQRPQLAFEGWLMSQNATEDCLRASLVSCLNDPLALPIYSLPIPDELKFDLIFGRKHVSLGVNVPELIRLAQMHGIQIGLASTKETTQAMQGSGNHIWRHQGRAIYIAQNKTRILLGEGFELRVFFHGEKPIDTLRALSEF